ncbi:MAG: replicative DNA helicase [Sulfuriferula multivorans]|uniref:Replicative DNA helicase n=1 Tax=Sulfuriferula multivorans TaxID=1559896 RepID=A0A7C9TD93_9PROT|nr:replicative DNA helicase [Sulfuriferula multivorans]
MNARDLPDIGIPSLVHLPPHSVEAEQAVLGGLLLVGADALDRIEGVIGVEDFYRDDHRRIFTAAKSLGESGKPVDAVTVAEALQSLGQLENVGGLSYIVALASNTPSAANIQRYAEIVRDKSILRGLYGVAIRTQAACMAQGLKDAEKIATEAETAMMRLLDRQGGEPVRAHDAIRGALREIDERRERGGKLAGQATGFENIDWITGGLEPGQLLILAARPSIGKTALALNIADNVASTGMPALFFTLEMTEQELAMRLMSARSGVAMTDMRSGTASPDDWHRLSAVCGDTADVPLFIDDRPGISVAYARAKARKIKRQHGLGLIVVDYLQLMKGPGENRTQEVGGISRALKGLAKELRVPVIALAQINRGVESRIDKRPQMSDLRESGDIEADADVIVMMHRNDGPEWHGLISLIVRKNRNGALGDITLQYDAPRLRFSDYLGQSPRSAPAKRPQRGFDD